MKKIIINTCFVLCVILVAGCTKVYEKGENISYYTDAEMQSILSDFLGSSRSVNIEVGEKTAIEIADTVMKDIFGEKILKNRKVCIGESHNEGVFIVSRILDEDVLGGDINVIIRKSDGAILSVWSGE